jgi:hypothetical protein
MMCYLYLREDECLIAVCEIPYINYYIIARFEFKAIPRLIG